MENPGDRQEAMANFPTRAIHLKKVSSMKDIKSSNKIYLGAQKKTLKLIIIDRRRYWIYKTKQIFAKQKRAENINKIKEEELLEIKNIIA